MKTRSHFSMMLFMSFVCLAAVARAQDEGSRSKSFNVSKGGTLEVSVSMGEIRVIPWEKNEVYVRAEGIDEEDLDRVKMTQTGSTVRVTFRPRWGNSYGDVRFEVNVPTQFNVDLNTSGGDLVIEGTLTGKVNGSTAGGAIKLGNIIAGPVDMSTSGGDIETKNIQGDGYLKTSGGEIRIGAVNGALDVNTSGGDIRVEKVGKTLDAKTAGGTIDIGDVGGEATVSTSGGDITVGKVSGRASLSTAGGDIILKGASGRVVAKTSGGDVRLENITGSIEAKTAGGEVEAELIPSGKGSSTLVSAGGNIKLSIPENARATIEAVIRVQDRWRKYSERYRIRSDFAAEKYEKDEEEEEIRATYKINGGGEMINLETVNADIDIHKSRAR